MLFLVVTLRTLPVDLTGLSVFCADDIEVRFYEEDVEGEMIWQAFGAFSAADIHHQVCSIISSLSSIRYSPILDLFS